MLRAGHRCLGMMQQRILGVHYAAVERCIVHEHGFQMTIVRTREFLRVLAVTLNSIVAVLNGDHNVQLTCHFIDRFHYGFRRLGVDFTVRPLPKNLFFFLRDFRQFPNDNHRIYVNSNEKGQ